MIKIRSRSPVRIAFAGGGTDVSPYKDEYGSCVLNATINLYAWTTLEVDHIKGIKIISDDYSKQIFANTKNNLKKDGELDLIKSVIHNMKHVENNFKVTLRSEVPPKSGLGGSGSAFASLIGAFNYLLNEKAMSQHDIAELAYKLEREDLGIPGGCQDQYATVFGGINFMEFKNESVKITPLKLSKSIIYELEKRLVLVHIGENRTQNDVNIIFDQIKSYHDKDTNKIEALHKTKELAKEMKYALLKGDLDLFGKLLNVAWEEKKKFSKHIANERINKLYSIAQKNGAMGGKLTGAGGGGHMLFLCQDDRENDVAKALEKEGCRVISFSFDFDGLQTWQVE